MGIQPALELIRNEGSVIIDTHSQLRTQEAVSAIKQGLLDKNEAISEIPN